MNRKIEIEKIVFSEKSKSELIEKSKNDFEKLINNNSQLKQELPKNCDLMDIELLKPDISIILDNEMETIPLIEFYFKLRFQKDTIGYYKSIYDINGEIKDDYFVLN